MVTAILIYLSAGAILWLVLDGTGVIDHTFAARRGASSQAMAIATVYFILAWPMFVWAWLKGMLAR